MPTITGTAGTDATLYSLLFFTYTDSCRQSQESRGFRKDFRSWQLNRPYPPNKSLRLLHKVVPFALWVNSLAEGKMVPVWTQHWVQMALLSSDSTWVWIKPCPCPLLAKIGSVKNGNWTSASGSHPRFLKVGESFWLWKSRLLSKKAGKWHWTIIKLWYSEAKMDMSRHCNIFEFN